MTRKLTIFFLSISGLLLLGHTIVQHDHNDFQQKNSFLSQQKSNLKYFYSLNLGPGHLEVFEKSESKSNNLVFLGNAKDKDGLEFDCSGNITLQPYYHSPPHLWSSQYLKNSFLRGPPDGFKT